MPATTSQIVYLTQSYNITLTPNTNLRNNTPHKKLTASITHANSNCSPSTFTIPQKPPRSPHRKRLQDTELEADCATTQLETWPTCKQRKGKRFPPRATFLFPIAFAPSDREKSHWQPPACLPACLPKQQAEASSSTVISSPENE
jgi:CHAT domain-containing protein